MSLENELKEATKFKAPKGGFNGRQDELASLAKAAHKLGDDDFDDLTDEAADWVNTAIKAINAKAAINDFEEGEDEAEAEAPDEDAQGDAEPEEAESDAEDAEGEEEVDHEAEEAAQALARPKPKRGRPKKQELVKGEELAKLVKEKGVTTRYDDLTGERDRFGCLIGTKTHDAVMMYERGTTTKEIWEKLGEGPTKIGGRFYNILKKLTLDGHLVERDAHGVFKLTHRDDLQGKVATPRPTKNTRLPFKKPKRPK